MSDLTYQQALDLLQADPAQFNSLQSLSDLAARVNVDAVGDVTILYGGKPANGIEPQQIFDAMKLNGDSIRILDDTDAATFLGSDAFRVAWASQFGLSQADLDVQPELLPPAKKQALVEMNNSLFHATDGPWAEASGRFVDATVGEIRTLTGGAAADRTFALVEVPRALANNNITHIDGIARADLVEVGAENAFKAISAQSDVYSAELKIATQADGSVFRDPDGRIRLDSQDYFGTTGLDGKPPSVDVGSYKNLGVLMPDRLSQHAAGADVLQDIYAKHEALSKTPDLPGVDNAALRASALRALDKLGWAGDLLALGLVAKEANAAYASGDSAEGNRLLGEWAANFAGGLAGGLAAAKLVGAALAPLYMAGPAGALIAGGLTLLAGLAGGIFGGEIAVAMSQRIADARAVILQRDPLVLDLDGDGLELSAASSNVLFDHNADGIKTGTGWARPDDGFLVRDLNGNGLIDSGRELFGVDTVKSNGQLATQGFDALADLDSNGDGQITSADAAWGQLQVWRDANQDGISQAGELSALDALGITRIGLNGSSTGPQAGPTINNNRVALSTTFTRNGVTRTVGAIDLEANGFFSEIPPEVVDEEGNPVVISEGALALPQMNGSGMVSFGGEAWLNLV